MNKLIGLFFFLVAHILVLEATAQESEAPMPGSGLMKMNTLEELKPQTSRVQLSDQKSDKAADHPEPVSGSISSAQGPEINIRRLGLGKHHSTDKSVAGGGVIIGGLVTAIFAAVFCYIRVTRKRNNSDY